MSGRRREPPQPPPVWKVQVAAHCVLPRYSIPALKVTLRAVDEGHARLEAIREAHCRAEQPVPPWRPFLRASWPHATAKPARRSKAEVVALQPADEQPDRKVAA
jgi:hypothetical protein